VKSKLSGEEKRPKKREREREREIDAIYTIDRIG